LPSSFRRTSGISIPIMGDNPPIQQATRSK
jgi:hypothetical protein